MTLIPAQAASGEAPASPAYLDLSWAIAPEHDVVGYNVYRAENSGAKGVKQNPELLPTPAFRDMNGVPGHVYYYAVTAVDRAGNESAPSAPVKRRRIGSGRRGTTACGCLLRPLRVVGHPAHKYLVPQREHRRA